MKEKETSKLYNSITNVDNQFIEEVQTKTKKKIPKWTKWGAVAACLCLVMAAALIIPTLPPTVQEDEIQSNAIADYPAMIMVDHRLYKDSGEMLDLPASTEQDGQIIASCDTIPTENNQSNFGTGYGYQYGEDNTIYVQFDDGWHIFVLNETENTFDTNQLTEQEQMDLDPGYNAD